jgi:hypothetical protein
MARRAATAKPGWKCPKCGRRFATKVAEHTCGTLPLSHHFEGKEPAVRAIYDRLLELARRSGPVRVASLKTTITLSAPVIFGGITMRRKGARVILTLTAPAQHPALLKTVWATGSKIAHEFAFTDAAELDQAFERLVREAYATAARD